MKQSIILFAFIIAMICLFASSAVYAESESEYDVSNVTTIIIGDSYGQMSYGGVKDGVEVDPGTRNDGFANCWTGRLAAKLGLSDVLIKKVKSTETNADFYLFEDNILYSAGGRGFCEYVSGTTYMTMVSELSEYTDPSEVRLIILGGGANDSKFYEQTKFRTRTVQLIETAHDIYPNAKIVLAQMGWGKFAEGTLPDDYIRYGAWDDRIQLGVEKLDPDLRDICEDYCYAGYAGNIGKEALSGQEEAFFTGKIVNSSNYEQADPIHPNYLGSEMLAKELYEKLTTMTFEHKYGEWKVTKNATCIENGSREQSCSNCGDLVKEEIPARGHTWKHYKKAMGLHKDGIEYDYCKTCKKKKNVKKLVGYATYYVKSFKVIRSKKAFVAKWAKQSAANQKKFNGYQIRYSLKSNMSAAKYTKASKFSKSKKIIGLKKKTIYYVQVRTYTKSGGKAFYSKWSPKKSVKTK